MNNYDTLVTGWTIVQLINDNRDVLGEILWATVVEDKKFRFRPNDFVCTSLIQSINDDYVYTSYSIYKLVDDGEEDFRLPAKSIILLRQGFSPEIVKSMIDNDTL